MGFEIRNKEGQALTLNALDQEAATLWGVDVENHTYASPFKKLVGPENYNELSEEEQKAWRKKSLDNARDRITCNWFDNIGFIIHKLKTSDWEAVRADYLEVYLDGLKKYEGSPDYEKIKEVFLGGHVKAMCDLIDIWKEKGYQPVYVNG
jgi:hypothetical protein